VNVKGVAEADGEVLCAAEELEPTHRANHLEMVRAPENWTGWLWKLQVRKRNEKKM
jgi:hypothetical protein